MYFFNYFVIQYYQIVEKKYVKLCRSTITNYRISIFDY